MRDCGGGGGGARRQRPRMLLALLAVLACVLWSPTMAEMSGRCPLECQCEADATIRCSGVTGLRTLDKSQPIARLVLSGLELVKIPASLENMRNITELDLSGNRLAEVSHLGKRIRKLNLSHNRITSGKLARIPPVVESLNLTHNEITHLPLHLMKLKRLRYIELANNPINCTCETLHVRNWLTSRHVWSDEHIKCMAPAEFKGRPWLQVRQSDVCHPTVVEERKGGYNWDDYEDDNELMQGDQAATHHVGEAVHDDNRHDDEEDDFRREYFPVGEKVKRQEPPPVLDNQVDADGDEASGGGPVLEDESPIGAEARARVFDSLTEGSGDDSVARLAHADSAADGNGEAGDDEADEGSGSGGGLLPDFNVHFEDSSTPVILDGDDGLVERKEEKEEAPLVTPADSGIPTDLGIFVDETSPASAADGDAESSTVQGGAGEGARVLAGGVMQTAVLVSNEGKPGAPLVEGDPTDGTTLEAQAEEDNRNTYILLAVLGIIVVSLILMVVCKRKDLPRNTGRNAKDAEQGNVGREMKEMKRNLLEKGPAAGDRNGGHGVAGGAPEQEPLMAKSDSEKVFGDPQKTAFTPVKPQRASLEKPLDSFKPIAAERNGGARHGEPDNNNTAALPNGNGAVRHGDPLPGVHKPAAPPVADATDSDGHHLLAEPPMESPRSKRYSPIYVPTSPKSDRYSPVYSPETGRVKIKLTETPKPKTPILVTRSRSRAGEIITTMDDQKF